MTIKEISNIRLNSQKIAAAEFKTANEIVKWMGAIQAQDFSMAKWAIGVRLPDITDKQIETSINNGEIIRIHVMRPTWHFISAEDIYWMLKLTAPKIKSSLKSRHKELELTEAVISKTKFIIEKTLSNGISLTRAELANEFEKVKIKTKGSRLSHILVRAELDGIICNGPVKENKQTYVLLNERVPHNKDLSRDESLAELAKRYFTSRCPATLYDFVWWSGLSVTEARQAMEYLKSDFITVTLGSEKFWFTNSFHDTGPEKTSVHLLPAFDEFLISYKDRSSSLSASVNKKTVSDNGIFHPSIVVNGQVNGLWKRTIKKNKVIIETDFFQPVNKSIRRLIDKKAFIFGQFLNKETEVIYKAE